jgi:flagellar biosynthesis protein FliP
MILAVVLLAVTIAVIPALLMFMNSGTRASVTYEKLNDELYTADAGIQTYPAHYQ